MKVQAHQTAHDISFVVLGDVNIQNAASAASEVRVWLKDDTEIHAGPGSHYEVIGMLPMSSDEALPVVQADTPTYNPMQAIVFQSGAQHPGCAAAPENGILIQTPAAAEALPLKLNG